MTPQELADFIIGSPAQYNGQTLLQIAQAGDTYSLRAALQDEATLPGYTAPVAMIETAKVWKKFFLTPQWAGIASSVRDNLALVIRENPYPIGEAESSAAVEAAITDGYGDVLAAWNELKTRPASYWEANGITDDLVNAAVGIIAG